MPTCRRGDGFADQVTADQGTIRGRAVPYGTTVELQPGLFERFRRGCFRDQCKDPARVRICLEHGQVIGRVDDLEERSDGLWFAGHLSDSPDIPEARKAAAMLADGLADELSVGFQTVRDGSTVTAADDGSVTWEHRRARLAEISLVPWGAYGRSAVVTRARAVDPVEGRRAAVRAQVTAWITANR